MNISGPQRKLNGYLLSEDEVKAINQDLPDGEKLNGSLFNADDLTKVLGCEWWDVDKVLQERYNFERGNDNNHL